MPSKLKFKLFAVWMAALMLLIVSPTQVPNNSFSGFQNLRLHLEEDESAYHLVKGEESIRYQKHKAEKPDQFMARHNRHSFVRENLPAQALNRLRLAHRIRTRAPPAA